MKNLICAEFNMIFKICQTFFKRFLFGQMVLTKVSMNIAYKLEF